MVPVRAAASPSVPIVVAKQPEVSFRCSGSVPAAVAALTVAAQQVRSRQRFHHLTRRASSQDGPSSTEDAKAGEAFTDVFATQVFKGGTPLLVEDGQLKFDVGSTAQAEGLSVKWGLLKERAASPDTSEAGRAERARRRAEAAEALVNIDEAERERRSLVGGVLAVAALIIAAALLAAHAPWGARAGLLPLVALAYGFRLSAEEGL